MVNRQSIVSAALAYAGRCGVVGTAFRWLAAWRGGPAFHPRGVTFEAELLIVDDELFPLPPGRNVVLARLSKGAGTPGPLPDVLGLAIRVDHSSGGVWDLLLSSAGRGRLTRYVPLPARSWWSARYGSITPYLVGGRRVWLQARADDGGANDASIATLSRGHLPRLALFVAGPGERWRRIGWLDPGSLLAGTSELAFDPVLNRPAEVRLEPAWLGTWRAAAYRGSRNGRMEA